MSQSLRPRRLIAIATAVLPLLVGCSKDITVPPPDGDRARSALEDALRAWQSGESYESLTTRDPPIYVADSDWSAGAKLLNFEIEPSSDALGGDLRCKVKLTLQATAPAPMAKVAVYSVATNPKLTVVREND